MASNAILYPTKNHPWLNGFGNIFSEVSHKWWGTRYWIIQVIIWMAIINGLLAVTVLSKPKVDPTQPPPTAADMAAMKSTIADVALQIFLNFSGLFAGVGVVVLAHDALIGEKRSGTAAWVLSKPLSRTAFILAKMGADAIGILVTFVIVQGVIAYFLIKIGLGISLPITSCLAAEGLVAMVLLFFLSLTYLLGAMSNARGLVLGLPMVLIFGYQLAIKVPVLVKIMPWNLVVDFPGSPALAFALIKGQPLATIAPIIGTAILTIVLAAAAVWRFHREEF
ncbi:MAG: ABC transporter permease [Acidobacteriaceae bacterium]